MSCPILQDVRSYSRWIWQSLFEGGFGAMPFEAIIKRYQEILGSRRKSVINRDLADVRKVRLTWCGWQFNYISIFTLISSACSAFDSHLHLKHNISKSNLGSTSRQLSPPLFSDLQMVAAGTCWNHHDLLPWPGCMMKMPSLAESLLQIPCLDPALGQWNHGILFGRFDTCSAISSTRFLQVENGSIYHSISYSSYL